MKKALSLLLALFAFLVIPSVGANFVPSAAEHAFNLVLMLAMAFSATFFVALFAWLTARRRRQRQTVR